MDKKQNEPLLKFPPTDGSIVVVVNRLIGNKSITFEASDAGVGNDRGSASLVTR